jgi:hypothetical protein
MAIVVTGLLRSAPFYQVKTAVETLSANFKSIQIEEIHETDWILFKEEMISHFSLTDYNLTVAVIFDG